MATTLEHKAAYLTGKGEKLKVVSLPNTGPNATDVVIRVKATAINPVDWKIQDYGIFIQKWPTILGEDIAGEVMEVGDEVKRFKKGDRVLAHALSLATGRTDESSFQEVALADQKVVVKLPDNVSFEQGSVLPLGLSTAAAGLFQDDFLGLRTPKSPAASNQNNEKILVWGGSSSVGSCAIQLAKAAGYGVVATSSEHNKKYCEEIGATKVFDYNSTSVVGDLVKELSEGKVVGAYDCKFFLLMNTYLHLSLVLFADNVLKQLLEHAIANCKPLR